MTTRIHANNFSTTLNGSISNSVTSVVLTSVTGFPSIGSGVTCTISVQNGSTNELMIATALSSFTLTVTRGAEGTTPSSFATGSTVEIRTTADSIDRKLDIADATDANLVTSDITTNNVSTTKHGFAPKAPNDATKYLDGTGAYTVPSGGGGGGGLVKIAVKTAASSATLDFTSDITSTYDSYIFVISAIKGSTAALQMLVSFDNGSTWKNTNSYNQASIYIRADSSTVSGHVAPNDPQFDLTIGQGSNATTDPVGGTITMTGYPDTKAQMFDWKISQLGNGGGYERYIIGGGNYYDGTTAPINAVRFQYASGSLVTGTITLYGYQK